MTLKVKDIQTQYQEKFMVELIIASWLTSLYL